MKAKTTDSSQLSLIPTFDVENKTSNISLGNTLISSKLDSWCRLIRDRRWSRAQKYQLLQHFNCPEIVLNTPSSQWRNLISGRVRESAPHVGQAFINSDLEWLSHKRHGVLTLFDDCYPNLLKQLPDPPIALFVSGDFNLLIEPQVAIVGSRSPTPVGGKVASSIAQGLALAGVTVTSGMALGIDGIAHRAALEAGGGSVAVLGNGLDIVYPARNRALFDSLESSGLLVSEYPLGAPPNRYSFPQRNRIVSGLSQGVVIVEAAEKSGTLITARLGLEQDREVMVVPGSALSAQYRGSHHLLNQGAVAVSNARDVLECLAQPLSTYLSSESGSINGSAVNNSKAPQGEEDAGVKTHFSHPLLDHISVESTSLDQIISSSQLTSAEVSSMLLELELQGAIAVAVDGGYVNLS